MKRDKVLKVLNTLKEISNEKLSPKAAYKIIQDRNLADSEAKKVEEIQNKLRPSQEYFIFEQKRLSLCEAAADKDEEGNAKKKKTINYQTGEIQEVFDIALENGKELEPKLNALAEEYKETIKEFQDIQQEFLNFLEEDVEINFVKLSLNDLPEKITPEQISVLMDIIEVGE